MSVEKTLAETSSQRQAQAQDLHEDIDTVDGFLDLCSRVVKIQHLEFNISLRVNGLWRTSSSVKDDKIDFPFFGGLSKEVGGGTSYKAIGAHETDCVDHGESMGVLVMW